MKRERFDQVGVIIWKIELINGIKNVKNDVEVIREIIQVIFNKIDEKKQKKNVKPWKMKLIKKKEKRISKMSLNQHTIPQING